MNYPRNTVAYDVFTVMILMYDSKWHDPLLLKNKEIYEEKINVDLLRKFFIDNIGSLEEDC
jgi:hypothetical protein